MTTQTEVTAEIAPLTTDDIDAAVDGHAATAAEARNALEVAGEGLSEFAAEIAEAQVPENHGAYAEPTVIHRTDDHVCLYVSHGTVAEMIANTPHGIQTDAAKAAGWAHNAYARRHGADADALGAMDAVVLPRTDAVENIITERA